MSIKTIRVMSEKNVKTIFCDIDGTILRQVDFNELNENNFEVLPGAREKFREWIEAGHHIVITTARPESLRGVTVRQLGNAGFQFHQLVMGIGREERILINNNSSKDPWRDRALSVSVRRDDGFYHSDWEEVGL
jgi:hydroxymethylpyrimidine pyrophosphatase-like HAD family hydrolase